MRLGLCEPAWCTNTPHRQNASRTQGLTPYLSPYAECQAETHWVPFLQSLVWPDSQSQGRHSNHKATELSGRPGFKYSICAWLTLHGLLNRYDNPKTCKPQPSGTPGRLEQILKLFERFQIEFERSSAAPHFTSCLVTSAWRGVIDYLYKLPT